MSAISENAKAIFLEAVEQHAPEDWPEFLEQACDDDRDLRGMVEGLLLAHAEKDSLFDRVEATLEYQPLVRPGQVIGPYKIREQIGDGGMGVVYVAQQEKPLRRKVALKVIKPGMDSKAVLARFDAERNALALMNHPNIAKVLDAGTTEQGHPYFVMELIQGKPVTQYCDEKKLPIKERLELFTQICNAVQHAHQKGVIHRDIKPTNILVTEIDGKPVPKVIDFGVAKALGANLTDRTVYTSYQSLVGTPLYMSPEQTQLSGVDVDTSSDVYSLGILLYELLTGTTPLSPEELKRAAQDEVLRRIRETEPPRPSNRISSLGETSSQVSQCRGAQPDQLGRLVRGDLDWIVMKALEKDRNRRYKTADAFAADIVRHLTNEPVEARPPSTAYRLNRFCRRNRMIVGVTGFVALVTFAASLAVALSIREAMRGRRLVANEVYDHNLNIAASGQLQPDSWRREGAQLGIEEDRIEFILGFNQQMLGDLSQAQDHYDAAKDLNPKNASVMSAGLLLALQTGKYEDYFDPANLKLLQEAQPTNPEDYLFLASTKMIAVSPSEAKKLADTAVERRPSPFAIAVRAKVSVWLYLMTGDSQDLLIADKQLEALHQLQDVYPMSPYFLETQLFVKTALIIFASESDRAVYIAEAREVADLMGKKYPAFGPARYRRAVFFDIIGETEASLDEWSAATKISGMSGWSVDEAFRKYRVGHIEEVRNSLDKLPQNAGYAIRALFCDTESGRLEAVECARQAFHAQQENQTLDDSNLRLLLYVGDLETSTSMADQLLSRDLEPMTLWSHWERAKLQYYASGDADALLETAGDSPLKQCDAYSLVGARLMCEGQRDEAIRYFERAIGTRVVWWPYHQVSVVYLESMKNDEDWPDWLPAKEDGHP